MLICLLITRDALDTGQFIHYFLMQKEVIVLESGSNEFCESRL